jgi:hypothetical protein
MPKSLHTVGCWGDKAENFEIEIFRSKKLASTSSRKLAKSLNSRQCEEAEEFVAKLGSWTTVIKRFYQTVKFFPNQVENYQLLVQTTSEDNLNNPLMRYKIAYLN